MKEHKKHLSPSIDAHLLRRFEDAAKSNNQSPSYLLNSIINKCIAEFEAEHGEIVLEEEK